MDIQIEISHIQPLNIRIAQRGDGIVIDDLSLVHMNSVCFMQLCNNLLCGNTTEHTSAFSCFHMEFQRDLRKLLFQVLCIRFLLLFLQIML